MHTLSRIALVSSAAVTALLVARSASAADSTRGALYIEAEPLGFGTISFASVCDSVDGVSFCGGGGSVTEYRLGFEVGYHFTGRHDGFVLGGRQVFLFGSGSAGTTEARLGYDIAIPIRQFEVTIAPYGVVGLSYGFSGAGKAAFTFGIGAEGKFFFTDHLYAEVTPIELGSWIGSGYDGVTYEVNSGIGYAF